MALAELLAAIESEGAAQVRAVLAEGDAAAATVGADAQRARNARIDSERRAWSAQRQRVADVEIAEAAQHARAEMLSARSAMLDRIRDEICALLPGLVAETGRALLDAALACAGGPGVARCAPQLAPLLPPELRSEPDPTLSGIEIELATGTRIVATLDALLEREWHALAAVALELAEAP